MKLVAINCSPRKQGNTAIMLEELCKAANADTETLHLCEFKISPCQEHVPCVEYCQIDDDMKQVYKKLESADVIVLGTPVWYNNVSSLCSIFMGRMRGVIKTKPLKGKKLGVVTVSKHNHGGNELAFTSILYWSLSQKLDMSCSRIPDFSKFGAIGHGDNPGDVRNDAEGLDSARKLGEMLTK